MHHVRPPPHNKCPRYDTKPSVGEAPELCGMWSMPLLPLLPDPL